MNPLSKPTWKALFNAITDGIKRLLAKKLKKGGLEKDGPRHKKNPSSPTSAAL
jgi:hypothetical protein